jgi:hypothetical protein
MDKVTEIHIAAWLACLAFVVFASRQLIGLWRELKGKDPNPPNDTLEAGRRELERRVLAGETALANLRQDIAHDREQTEISARSRSAGVYNKVEEVRKELSCKVDELRDEVGQQFKDTERALGRIEGKLSKGEL